MLNANKFHSDVNIRLIIYDYTNIRQTPIRLMFYLFPCQAEYITLLQSNIYLKNICFTNTQVHFITLLKIICMHIPSIFHYTLFKRTQKLYFQTSLGGIFRSLKILNYDSVRNLIHIILGFVIYLVSFIVLCLSSSDKDGIREYLKSFPFN